jgi:hypothetical protein
MIFTPLSEVTFTQYACPLMNITMHANEQLALQKEVATKGKEFT